MPLISVVIPVHGVEDYLDRCLDSVLSDLAVPVEVIAVDDASPDRCGAILAARPDPRLRVLTTPVAGGPGAARDLGAKEATGEYVWFVDGDDELAEGALAAVAEALARLRPDVLVIDYENLYPDGTTSPSDGARYLGGPEAGPLADHPGLIHLPMTAWSKVFRRDFLAGLGISFGSAGPAPHEDVPVTTLALLTAGRIGVLNRVCYRYRRARRGSYLAAVSAANFNIFGSYQRIFDFIAERAGLRAPVAPRRLYRGIRTGRLALHHAAAPGAAPPPPRVLPPDDRRLPALASRRVPVPARPARRQVPAGVARRLRRLHAARSGESAAREAAWSEVTGLG